MSKSLILQFVLRAAMAYGGLLILVSLFLSGPLTNRSVQDWLIFFGLVALTSLGAWLSVRTFDRFRFPKSPHSPSAHTKAAFGFGLLTGLACAVPLGFYFAESRPGQAPLVWLYVLWAMLSFGFAWFMWWSYFTSKLITRLLST